MKPQFSIWAFSLAPEDPGDWSPLFERARAADAAGVDRLVLTGEHVVFGENLEAYGRPELGGREGGRQITGPDGCYLEPMVVMSMIAAVTTRIRITSNIMLAALRRPVVLAKAAATLDVLSGGRFDLAVGVGWQREEYEAAGLVFEQRGRLLDHTLEVCRTLWRDRRASYAAPELAFQHIHMAPKPLGPDGVPVWVSGTVNPRAMQRLARFGSGWIPWGRALDCADDLLEEIPKMREAVAGCGRDPSAIQIAGALPLVGGADGAPAIGPTMERARALVDAGVTDVRASLPIPGDRQAAEDYLAEWVAAFRAATS
jgi:probable F420-dependent oxidoreductase